MGIEAAEAMSSALYLSENVYLRTADSWGFWEVWLSGT